KADGRRDLGPSQSGGRLPPAPGVGQRRAASAPAGGARLMVRPNYRATGELSSRSDSVRGLAAIQRHFTAGEAGPVTVLLASRTGWAGKEGEEFLAHLSQGLARLDNVAEVRSLTQPLGVSAELREGEAPAEQGADGSPGASPSRGD